MTAPGWAFHWSHPWAGRELRSSNRLDYSLGTTLYMVGDAKIDLTSQGVRAAGEFDTNYILFLGGTVRYRF
jgi:hypothetical protein